MATQRTLPLILSPEQPLEDLWERLPASRRSEVIVLYAQLIDRGHDLAFARMHVTARSIRG